MVGKGAGLCVFMLAATAVVLSAAGTVCAADLAVTAAGFKGEKGSAVFFLWRNGEGFPGKTEQASTKLSAEIKGGGASVVFKGLEPGTYAVSLAHDENGNGKMDTGFMGKPKEGYAASNNPKNRFSAPSFDECKFSLSDSSKTIDLQVRY